MLQRPWFVIGWPIVVAIVAAAIAIFVANSQARSKLNTVDRDLALWNVQPGLGTVMIEYGVRFGNAWWAADAGNWDMAKYQVKEMTEIQEVGETTRPGRADALKKFEHDNIDPLMAAINAKDKDAFVSAYDRAITGCNQCHGDQKDAQGNNFRWIKVTRPTTSAPFSNVDWKAQ